MVSGGRPTDKVLGRRALTWLVATTVALEAISRCLVAPLTVRGGPEQVLDLLHQIRTSPRDPVLVFLGTSHVQCAIVPAVIERRLGLPRGAVLSAGMGLTGPYEQSRLYTSVESRLRSARLIVLEISPMSLNRTISAEERVRLDLATRLHYPAEALTRADWLLGWVLSVWDVRRTWRGLADSVSRAALRETGVVGPVDAEGYASLAGRPASRGQLASDAERRAFLHFKTYSVDEAALGDLSALLDRIEAHGTRVLLCEYPVSSEYRKLLQTRYREADQLEHGVASGLMHRYPMARSGREIEGELLDEFRDSDHLTRAGAVRFSQIVARWPEVLAIFGGEDSRVTAAR